MIIPPFGPNRHRKPRHTNIRAVAYSDDDRTCKLHRYAGQNSTSENMQAVRQLLEP
jgi:hypothetical protein